MKFAFVLFFPFVLFATDTVNFIDLQVTPKDGMLEITATPQRLLDYKLVKNEAYSLRKGNVDQILDGPLRQTAFLIRTLERNRGSLITGTEPLPVLSFDFTLAMRDLTGEPITELEYTVVVGLDSEVGMGLITVEGTSIAYRFPINDLNQLETYQQFVTHLALPFETRSFKEPTSNQCIFDIYYRWPKLVQDQSKVNVFDLFPAWLTYDKGFIKKVSIHLGSTFVYKKGGQWQAAPSTYLHAARDAIDQYGEVINLVELGDINDSIAALEEYVDKVPGDKKALKLLMDQYLDDQRSAEAYNLISRFQPLFATIRGGLPNQKALAEKADRRRNFLLGRKSSFLRNNEVVLKINSPVDGDLVTGTTELNFSLATADSPILAVECFLGDQLITRMTEPPFKVPFTVDGTYGFTDVRVVAYFEDETYQQDKIRVRTIRVDEQESVHLVGVRASVFQKGLTGKELKKEDFRIEENGTNKPIDSFRKDTAPLRVAILIDTSISMVGEKLYRAQYAVRTFLSKLAPDDRVAIYTFDDQVLKLSDFSNDYPQLSIEVMSLSMQWGTSLYDAMLIAHDGLLGQNGTKVMIVLSDGDDSASSTTDLHVVNIIRNSPVMVYSMILPGGIFPDSKDGEELLRHIAELSGSISLRVRNVDKLDATFTRLYEDLKSFYYMDYYSSITERGKREVEVKIKGVRGKVRSRAMN